jgi:hypothetical protein
VALWTLCVGAVAVAGRQRLAGAAAGGWPFGPPALVLAATVACGSVGAALVLAVAAAGTGFVAADLYSAVRPAGAAVQAATLAAALVVIYAAVLVRRYRAELAGAPRFAVRVAIATEGRVAVVAALAVVLLAAVPACVSGGAVRAGALAPLLAAATALVTGSTLVPALLTGFPARPARWVARPGRWVARPGLLAVRHPVAALGFAAGLLVGCVVAVRAAPSCDLSVAPAAVLVAVLLPLRRACAAKLTGMTRGRAVELAVRVTAGTTVAAAAGAGCVLAATGAAVSLVAAAVLVVGTVALGVLAVPAVLMLGARAQHAVSGTSAVSMNLDACHEGDGGGAACRK